METTRSFSLKNNAAAADHSTRELQKTLREYKMLAEASRADLESMKNKISLSKHLTAKSISPQIGEMMGELQKEIERQKIKDDSIQNQITYLKNEESDIQQHIISYNTRCQILEEKIGLN